MFFCKSLKVLKSSALISPALSLPLTAVLAVTLAVDANCQPQQYQGTAQAPRRPAPVESIHRPLTQWPSSVPISLPPDAKFVSGYQSQYLTTKTMTFMRFTTVNPAAAVVDWYKRSLEASGWTVKESGTAAGRSAAAISALRNGVSCNINVMAPLSPKDRTTVTVSFTDR